MKKVIFYFSLVLSSFFQACDKIDAPYGEGSTPAPTNSINIDAGTINGSIIDYSVTSATESDTSFLYASWYYTVSGDTSFASVVFTWNGNKSDSIISYTTPIGPVHFDDTLAIAAGSPFGTLNFHYIADITVTGSGTGTVVVIIANAQVVKKVLLVDFTGQKCQFCPRGARKLTELEGIYGEQLIGIAIHAGNYAIPATSGTMYTYDFRTPEGNQLSANLSVSNYPNGSINFKEFNGSVLQQYPSWGGNVSNLLKLAPEASIEITQNYNATSRESSVSIESVFLKQRTGNYNLVVYLIEDGIVNWQLDVDALPPDNPNYIHRHVLRGSYSGVYGELIATDPLLNSAFTKTYNLLINNTYNQNNCSVVAFVMDADTREVVQAEKVNLIP